MNKLESNAYILAAGQQQRYGQHESKMMAKVNERPAFAYTMDTLLTVFPQDRITVVTSTLFPDFNNFFVESYPQSRIVLDNDPGKGTAHSLSKTFPWESESAFVTEADIFYTPDLIAKHNALNEENMNKTIVTATPKTEIAVTHRGLDVSESLTIFDSSNQPDKPKYRNVGAHTINSKVKEYYNGETENVIDLLRLMCLAGEPVIGHVYLSAYLHMAAREDVNEWVKYFDKTDK